MVRHLKPTFCLQPVSDIKDIYTSTRNFLKNFKKGDILTERCIGMINQSNLKGKALADTFLVSFKVTKLALAKNDWLRL